MNAFTGVRKAMSVKTKAFVLITITIFILNVFVPPLVLSIVRKPADLFMMNPFVSKLPGYLTSDEMIDKKFAFLSNLALFWFVASGPFAPEWGFAVTFADTIRFLAMGIIFGAYFSVLSYLKSRTPRQAARGARPGGVAGTFLSFLGFSTGPCTVVGCGAPVIPVVGLALVGLSSGTLLLIAEIGKVATAAVMAVMVIAVLYLGRLVNRTEVLLDVSSLQR